MENPAGKRNFRMSHSFFEIDMKYVPIRLIGKGAYGVVCSSINQETKETVAIKKISGVFDNNVTALRTLRELMILRQLSHQNVIGLKDIMMPVHRKSFNDVYLVYDLMATDLQQIIHSPQPLSDFHVQYIIYQLLQGLKYLHSASILHRDLKPGNILLNANCDLKICDFGLARTNATESGEFMTEYVVTRWYRAPEILLGCHTYGTSIDVWSVGCIFAELLRRVALFPGNNTLNQLEMIFIVLGTPSVEDMGFVDNPRSLEFLKSVPYTPAMPLNYVYPKANRLAVDLLLKMLVFDPRKRIGVDEALQHPYLSHLSDPAMDKPANRAIDLAIDEKMGVNELREKIWQEALFYHPENLLPETLF